MARYRKKPVEVEAWQVGSDEPRPDWLTDKVVRAARGWEGAWIKKGDWIVKEDDYPFIVDEKSFEKNYEPAIEPACPDCGATLNTNWGHCPECDEWREL